MDSMYLKKIILVIYMFYWRTQFYIRLISLIWYKKIHSNPDSFFTLMRKAHDPAATPETRKKLENISKSCHIFQRLSKEPSRFRVSLHQEYIIFNRTFLIDHISLESKTVLHIVKKDTLISISFSMNDIETSENICK